MSGDAPTYTFSIGDQPCHTFAGRDDVLSGLGNRHECFGPYPKATGVERCSRSVSFCERCHRDHHEGGWNMCGAPKP